MKRLLTAVGASAIAGMASVALATAATAAVIGPPGSLVPAVPDEDNQMCGNALVNPDVAVEDVTVTASLYDSGNSLVFGPEVVDTDSMGAWCITGDSALASTVLGGGYVHLCATPATVSGKSANFLNSGSNCTDLDAVAFQDHLYTDFLSGIFTSADGLDVVYA